MLYEFGLSGQDPAAADRTKPTPPPKEKKVGPGHIMPKITIPQRPPPPKPTPTPTTPTSKLLQYPDKPFKDREELQDWYNAQIQIASTDQEREVLEKMYMEKRSEVPLKVSPGKGKNPFWDTVVPLAGYEDVILSSFQYQEDGTETTDNDCTEAAMAMLMTMELAKYDPSSKGIRFGDLAREMDRQWWEFYRFPAKSPLPGVTPPTGAVKLLIDYGESHEPGWTAELSPLSTTDDLLQNIMDGNPTMIYGVNLTGKKLPHAVVPVGFDTATKNVDHLKSWDRRG
jgi:hypothetical protein